jgi:hypothetical protein
LSPKYFQPALLGGLMMGVLSALPIVNIGNCCCLWVIGGGVVAAYLLQGSHPQPISAGDGALVGLLAGLFGAVVWLVVSIPLNMALGPFQRRLFERILENAQDIPDNMRALFEGTATGAAMGIAYLVQFVVWLCIGAVFSTLGGLLGAAIFKKKLPPSAAPTAF